MAVITCNEDNDNEEWWATFGNDRSAKIGVAALFFSADPTWRAKQKAGAQANAQDPEWRAKLKVQGQANAQNPNWRANQKAGVQAKAQDPEWRAKQKAGIQAKTQDPDWKAKQLAGAKVRSQDPTWRENVSAASQRTRLSRSKPYHSPQGDFASVGDAIKASGLHQSKFRQLARLDPTNYYYLPKPTE